MSAVSSIKKSYKYNILMIKSDLLNKTQLFHKMTSLRIFPTFSIIQGISMVYKLLKSEIKLNFCLKDKETAAAAATT